MRCRGGMPPGDERVPHRQNDACRSPEDSRARSLPGEGGMPASAMLTGAAAASCARVHPARAGARRVALDRAGWHDLRPRWAGLDGVRRSDAINTYTRARALYLIFVLLISTVKTRFKPGYTM